MRNRKAVISNYYCVYEHEVRARLRVQINAMKVRLKLVDISHTHVGESRRTRGLDIAILIYINTTSVSAFRPLTFAHFPKSLRRKDFKHAMEGKVMREKTNSSIEMAKNLRKRQDEKRKVVKGKRRYKKIFAKENGALRAQ